MIHTLFFSSFACVGTCTLTDDGKRHFVPLLLVFIVFVLTAGRVLYYIVFSVVGGAILVLTIIVVVSVVMLKATRRIQKNKRTLCEF